jgi:hypothetical protein
MKFFCRFDSFAADGYLECTEITEPDNLAVIQMTLQHFGQVVQYRQHIGVAHRSTAFGNLFAEFL